MAFQAAFLYESLLADLALKPLIVLVNSHMLLQSPRSSEGFGAYIAGVHFSARMPGQVVGETAFREEFSIALVT